MVGYDLHYTVGGNDPDNRWRRDNLLKCPGCVEHDAYFEVSFQFVENSGRYPTQIRLTYRIPK